MDQLNLSNTHFRPYTNNIVVKSKNLNRWIVLVIVSVGSLMVIAAQSIINITLPIIKTDLGFSNSNLSLVVNVYLLSFGGFLLLSGRIGDYFGNKKIFLLGIVIFTISSIGSGLAVSKEIFLIFRSLQGFAGSIISVISLSVIIRLFPESKAKAKAFGIYASVMSVGGSIGILLGGIIATFAPWQWIFFINIPIGVIIYVLGLKFIPSTILKGGKEKLYNSYIYFSFHLFFYCFL